MNWFYLSNDGIQGWAVAFMKGGYFLAICMLVSFSRTMDAQGNVGVAFSPNVFTPFEPLKWRL
jgi:hypothetical protein